MRTGVVIAGRFELQEEAGSGGMGTVFRALDRHDGSLVALKILRGQDPLDVDRFARETATLASLRHPGIVRYVAHGLGPDEEHYLAMEWLAGEDLTARLARGRLSLDESLIVLRRTAEALAATHALGMIHRDIKPANLFLPDGDVERLKLLDFGLARRALDPHKLTQVGGFVGTPGYMAPEQIYGDMDQDARTDVFSLGCVAFECLTGLAAFHGDTPMAILAKLVLQETPSVRALEADVPESLDRLVTRMLAKDPNDRPSSASELAVELSSIDDARGRSTRFSERAAAAVAPTAWSARDGDFEADRPTGSLTMREQRLVTVVFAGDPDAEESASGRRDSVASALQAAIDPYGGKVNVLPGGSLIVTAWGPGTAADRAERAARCALSLKSHLAHVPIYIATGRGLVSARVIEGAVIDRGVRALRGARRGAVQVDDVTATLVDSKLRVESHGALLFLEGETAAQEKAPLLLGKPSKCVGRSGEISMLEGTLAGCISEPMAAAVLVTGPSGSGKSRLAWELLERAKKLPASVEMLVGRATWLSAGAPLGVLADALRRTSGIHEGEPIESRRDKLVRRLARHLPAPVLRRTCAFLGEIVASPFPDEHDDALRAARENAQLMADGVRAAWEDWLTGECAARPVLLVLEDLHWGDAGTIRLVDSTLRNLRDLPLMILVLARPEIHAQFPGLWAEREVHLIKLGPLNRKANERIVRDALGERASEVVVERVVHHAEGNPFYLEELIRVVAAGRGEALPDSVLGTVEARLDAEGTEAKRLLRAASVFGDRFTSEGVALLVGGERHLRDVDAWLETLASHEILAPASSPAAAGKACYTFCHATVREAAYAMLTDADRLLGHQLVGEWLERSGHTDALAMAEHFRRGGELLRAVKWYQRAAEQALDANDLAAAQQRAELGIACGAAGEELGGLRLVEAEVALWQGELGLAEQRGIEALDLLARGSLPWFLAARQAVIAAAKLGAFDRVEARVGPILATLSAPGAGGVKLGCLGECAIQLTFGGRYAAADELIERIDEAIGDSQAQDPQVQALLLQMRAIRATFAGDLGACLEGFEGALAASEQAGDRRNACVIRSNLGFSLTELGDFEGAERVLRAALAAAERMGLHDLSTVVLHNLGHALAYRGRLDEAAHLERRAVEAFQRQGEPRMEGIARTYLAKIALLSGDLATAELEARTAEQRLGVAPPLQAGAIAVLARIFLGAGRVDEALAKAREAFSTLEALGALEEGESLVRLVHAEALAAAGRGAELDAALVAACASVRARAAKISDPAWRERFLSQVPDNAAILALACE